MAAIRIAAHVIEGHLVVRLSRIGLKEDDLVVAALRTLEITSARERGIRDDVRDDLRQLVDFVSDLVHVDAWIIGRLLMVTVSALLSINQRLAAIQMLLSLGDFSR